MHTRSGSSPSASSHVPLQRMSSTLRRRMRRILVLMIEGGALERHYEGELATQGTRWYVGPTVVNPTAARSLIRVGLMRAIPSDGGWSCYELTDRAREQLTRSLHRLDSAGANVEMGYAQVIDEAIISTTEVHITPD
jgi:hypothetical protein